jgi:hypothetical protein
LTIEAQATIRYVSKTGTSTPPYTSWESAADSIQKCINICVDGDTIYVANGVYKENLVINTAISLIGSSMDSTVIDGRGMENYSINIKKNVTIENFNLYGKAYGSGICVYSVSSNFPVITVRNCNISAAAGGIASYGLNVEKVILKNLQGGINPAGLPNSNNFISNCVINVEGNYATGISLGGPTYANYEINNNIILFSGTANPDNGISIGAPRRIIIKNNLISGFSDNIFIDTVSDTVFIINNLLAFQKIGLGSISTSGNRVLANNLIFNKNQVGIEHSGSGFVMSDYNLFWKNTIEDLNGVTYGDSDRIADPIFVNDTIPTVGGNYDFHLQKYSPAIDKGDPNILDKDGSRSDIGMYGGPFGETYTYQDLAPLAPRNLSAVVDSHNITVKWNRNTEADTSFYKVYRDTVSGFTIDSTKLISSSADTFFVQPNPHINTRYVYKVKCVDNQGNESLPSNELVVNITSVSTNDYPMTISDYVLYQNYPNPFNPSTKIGYQLKERAYVKLMVYDIKGELVSVLVNKEQNAGYYEAEFSSSSIKNQESSIQNLASGIYLYRIEIIGEGKIPVYTEMKKMLLIK